MHYIDHNSSISCEHKDFQDLNPCIRVRIETEIHGERLEVHVDQVLKFDKDVKLDLYYMWLKCKFEAEV
jgi:hypothetical protein